MKKLEITDMQNVEGGYAWIPAIVCVGGACIQAIGIYYAARLIDYCFYDA